MLRSVSNWLGAGFAAAMLISRAQAAEASALAISANIQVGHLPYGTILDPIYAAPDSDQIVDYTRCGDSAIWTGHYLAAEAFRYQVTGSADALNNVKNAVAGINSLIQVTGTNLLARCLVPLNSPYATSIRSQEASNGIYTNSSAGYFWVGNTSRDQYLGVAFGLAVAYDMVNDAGVEELDQPDRVVVDRIFDRPRLVGSDAGWKLQHHLPDPSGSGPDAVADRPACESGEI